MADDVDQGERSEEATQARREDFRKRGQVVQTKELASALFILVGLGLVYVLERFFMSHITELFSYTIGPNLIFAVKQGDVLPAIRFAGEKMGILIAPVLGVGLLISLGSTFIQVGFLQVENALSADISRINPLQGLKRIFSIRNLIEGGKNFSKLLLMMAVVFFTFRSEMWKMPWLMQFEVPQAMEYLESLVGKLLGSLGISIVILAVVDYFLQKWEMEKKMKMTKQEVKEEHKSREGDPLIRARIRKVQREVAYRRMMNKVPKADVIITNPTHIAVALKYDANLPAPQLLAKGADLIAEKIKEIAVKHDIPIVENKPLARTIFKTMKLGQIIPKELFIAVAEVLSYVYKLKKKRVTK